MNFDQLLNDGFCILKFNDITTLFKLQNLIQQFLSFAPKYWHKHIKSQDAHNQLIVTLGEHIAQSDLLNNLLNEHILSFKELYGPDIDIQKIPDVRVTRPFQNQDLVNWHRDTFYGGSPWQLNLWLPVFDLPEQTGLLLISGSHNQPSFNVRNLIDSIYPSEMVDDSISEMDEAQIRLLTPCSEEAVIFFGCAIHRAINPSNLTRFSLDIRLRSAQITDEESKFYKPFCRGLIGTCVEKFLSVSENI